MIGTMLKTFHESPAVHGNELVPAFSNLGYPWSLNNPNLQLNDYSTWEHILDGNGGKDSAAGVRITHDVAVTFGPVMRALRILGGDTACSPLHVCFKNVEPGDDCVDVNHPADYLCSGMMNDRTPAAAGWERLVQEASLYGTGYLWIERDSRDITDDATKNWGRVTGLYHLSPIWTTPRVAECEGILGNEEVGYLYVHKGEPYYETEAGGKTVYLAWNEVLELQPFKAVRLPMLNVIKNVVGLALAAQGYQSRFFSNGGQSGGFIQVPPGSTPASVLNLQKELRKRQSNDAWFKVHILQDGATFQKLTVDPQAKDMGEIDERAARRVADYFNIEPSKMGLPGSDSYGAGESARTNHITGTMNHLFKQLQGECFAKLFNPRTRQEKGKNAREFRHFYDELIRPDYPTHVRTLLDLRKGCVINSNDVLQALGLKLRSDPQAFEYFNPMSTSKTLDEVDETPDDRDADATDNASDETTDKPARKKKTRKKSTQRTRRVVDTNSDKDLPDESTTRPDETEATWRASVEPRIKQAAFRLSRLAGNKARRPEDFKTLLTTGFAAHRNVFDEEVIVIAQAFHRSDAKSLVFAQQTFLTEFTATLVDCLAEVPSGTTTREQADIRRTAAQTACETFSNSPAISRIVDCWS